MGIAKKISFPREIMLRFSSFFEIIKHLGLFPKLNTRSRKLVSKKDFQI